MTGRWHIEAGAAGSSGFALDVSPEVAGWTYSGLRILNLELAGSHTIHTAEFETIVLPLAGSATVSCDGHTFELTGRDGVFAGPTDFAYLPRDASALITSATGGRFALPAARCENRLAPRYGPAGGVEVELRGAGACSRQVNNFCLPSTFAADKLLACEVITPAGNWSSYPPHKHDEELVDEHGDQLETVLEEIYYFEVARGGPAYHRVYGPGIDVLAEVRSGDVVLVPHGWHGPSMAAPGYDLYYLNVMAGPGRERAWLISDDPDYAWIRETWTGQPIDPRLPMRGAR